MDLLIVEDDAHKYSRILGIISKSPVKLNVTHCDNVSSAIDVVGLTYPDKIILDMSLPSHPTVRGEGNPLPMPNGGIEVILELRILQKAGIPILILTQYSDIEVEYEYYSIIEAEEVIKRLYGILDISVVHYDDESEEWEDSVVKFLGQ